SMILGLVLVVVTPARDDGGEDGFVSFVSDERLRREVHVDPLFAGLQVRRWRDRARDGRVGFANEEALHRFEVALSLEGLAPRRERHEREARDRLEARRRAGVGKSYFERALEQKCDGKLARLVVVADPDALEFGRRLMHENVIERDVAAARRAPHLT